MFKTELDNARAVRDGELDLPLLPVLYEYPDELLSVDAWKDHKTWFMVNPNLGRSVDKPFLEREVGKALRDGGEQMLLIASQHFNVEIGTRLRADGWVGAKYWDQRADRSLTLDEFIQRCDVIVAGVDGGGLDDLLGLALIGRCKLTGVWLVWNRAWAHSTVWERRKEIASTLDDFVADGSLVKCERPTQDLEELAAILVRINDAGLLPETDAVGLDPQAITELVAECVRQGLAFEQMQGIAQGFRLSSAIWTMERKLSDGTIWHAGQPLMSWCVGNAKVEQRGNAVLITKQTAGKAKIDPLIATFNAVALMGRQPEPNAKVDDWIASFA